MALSDEGVRLLSKVALLLLVIVVTAFARTVVGRNPTRQFRMGLGTIGGLTAGVTIAAPASAWFGSDVSSLAALSGIFIGWTVAYQFVKHLPRNAPSRPTPWRTL